MLEIIGREVVLKSYRTLVLEKDIVDNGKILNMDRLAAKLMELSKGFVRYTNRIVTSLPRTMLTIEYFDYDPQGERVLENEAEFRAGKMSKLDEIVFDFLLMPEAGVRNNALLAVAKLTDVDSRVYLTEVCDLDLKYLDAEVVGRVNAFSYWINQEMPELENEIVAIYDIGITSTQIVFARQGRLLYADRINIGVSHLFHDIPEYADLEDAGVFSLVHKPLDLGGLEAHVEAASNRLIQEINRSVRLFGVQNPVGGGAEEEEIKYIFLTGIGVRVYDLVQPLRQLTGIEVRAVNPINSVQSGRETAQFKIDAYDLTVAFGLALRGFL